LDSINGDQHDFKGQCLLTEQGMMSVLINPVERERSKSRNFYMASDQEIETILSQSTHFATQVVSADEGECGCEVLVSQTAVALDLSLCCYQLDQQQLTLSWRVVGKPDERWVTRWRAS
jgi:hypothetical protein